MKIKNQEILDRFDEIVKNLKESTKVAIIHDADPDGFTSAVILTKALDKITGIKHILELPRMTDSHQITPEMQESIKNSGIEVVFSVDLSLDEDEEGLEEAAKTAKIVVIDNHKVKDIQFENRNILIVKPQLIYDVADPAKYNSSKITYDLFSRHTNLEELDWVA